VFIFEPIGKFTSHIFKRKQIVCFMVLLCFVAILVLPQVASAGYVVPSPNIPSTCGPLAVGCWLRWVINIALKLMVAPTLIVLALAQIITSILSFIVVNILKWLLLVVITQIQYTSLNPDLNPAVAIGWPIVRNFANTFIVLGFIVIAVATILRIKEYEAKALLAKLVIAALLVNFSLVVCGLVIDASHIVIAFFFDGTSGRISNTEVNFSVITNLWQNVLNVLDPTVSLPAVIARMAGNILYDVMSIIVYGLFAFLFIFRVIILWILVILSPLAFVSYVFPATKGMVFDKWWSNFTQWCFVGVFGAFFLNIGTQLITFMNAHPNAFMTNGIIQNPGLGDLITAFTSSMHFMVPAMFLIIGFVFSLQMSAMGSGAAIGAFKGSAKYMKQGGKWAADKTGLTKRAQQVSDGMTRGLEQAGFLRAGTTDAIEANRHKEALADKDRRSAAESMDQDARIEKIRARNNTTLGGRAYTQRGESDTYDRAAIVEEMAKDGQLEALRTAVGDDEYERVMREANANGARAKTVAKEDYTVAGFDDRRREGYVADNPDNPGTRMATQIDDYITANPMTNGAPTSRAQAHQAVATQNIVREQLEENVGKMSKKQKSRIRPQDITADVVMGGAFTPSVIRDFQSAPAPVKTALRGTIPAITARINTLRGAVSPDTEEIKRLKNLRTALRRLRP